MTSAEHLKLDDCFDVRNEVYDAEQRLCANIRTDGEKENSIEFFVPEITTPNELIKSVVHLVRQLQVDSETLLDWKFIFSQDEIPIIYNE
jgi:hypothetical protein